MLSRKTIREASEVGYAEREAQETCLLSPFSFWLLWEERRRGVSCGDHVWRHGWEGQRQRPFRLFKFLKHPHSYYFILLPKRSQVSLDNCVHNHFSWLLYRFLHQTKVAVSPFSRTQRN